MMSYPIYLKMLRHDAAQWVSRDPFCARRLLRDMDEVIIFVSDEKETHA